MIPSYVCIIPTSTDYLLIFSFYNIKHSEGLVQLVEALRYKPEGSGFNSRCCHWNFSLKPFGRTMPLESTQSLIEMSTRNICWGVKVAGV